MTVKNDDEGKKLGQDFAKAARTVFIGSIFPAAFVPLLILDGGTYVFNKFILPEIRKGTDNDGPK